MNWWGCSVLRPRAGSWEGARGRVGWFLPNRERPDSSEGRCRDAGHARPPRAGLASAPTCLFSCLSQLRRREKDAFLLPLPPLRVIHSETIKCSLRSRLQESGGEYSHNLEQPMGDALGLNQGQDHAQISGFGAILPRFKFKLCNSLAV